MSDIANLVLDSLAPRFSEEVEAKWGPAMLALHQKHRAFVQVYCVTGSASRAAREAGYGTQTGQALKDRPDIVAAIRETLVLQMSGNTPTYVLTLEDVALNPQHKDQVKALGMLLSRGGLPEVTQRDVNVTVTMSREQQMAEIRQMAEEMGLDPTRLLGTVTDAEFEELGPPSPSSHPAPPQPAAITAEDLI